MSELLDEIGDLRRRARADRDVHWFPLVVFGLLVLAASLAYQRTILGLDPSDWIVVEGPHDRYWLVALPIGVLATLWWYRRHGSRVGLEGPVGRAVVVAVLAVVAYYGLSLVLGTNMALQPLFWVEIRDLGALLVIAVLLLALAALERDPLLGVAAVAYASVAALANFYDLQNVLPYPPGGEGIGRWSTMPNLYVPAAVLLAGAAALGLRARVRRTA